ncbi:JAB domain-containing protein [Paenibacillus jiagnxiensis]|uniref:JAB domain-containing protein n=1 Tax=Paenibacillus jiagnxiensis TaxID=3228926 RepID=UPI0033BC95C1
MKLVSIYKVQLMKAGTVPIEHKVIGGAEDAQNICRSFLLHEYGGFFPDREVFGAVWLNTKNEPVGLEIVSVGSLNAGIVHPRETFKSGILHNAASLIVFHNHPSGNTTPSNEDVQVTKRLAEAGNILGVDLLDHIILGEYGYTSLKGQGLF